MTELEMFEAQWNKLPEGNLKDFVQEAVKHIPEAFWTIPSSRTGKHHPPFANGEGGLLRHTLASLYFGRELCIAYGLNDDDRLVVTAALLLHDIGKAIAEPHDIVWTTKLRWIARGKYDSFEVLRVIGAVRWHMGRWATGSTDCDEAERGVKAFPDNFTTIEQVVHLADYAASRKRCDLTKLEV